MAMLPPGEAWRPAEPRHDLATLVRLNHHALASLLQLPGGAYVDHVLQAADQPGMLDLRVRGIGVPVRPGMLLPSITPTLTTGDHGRLVIDWEGPLRAAVQSLARWPQGTTR